MQSTMKVVVKERVQCGDKVVALTLNRPDGAALPEWDAGAHVDVQVLDKLGAPAMRQYSLCGAQEPARDWRIAVLDECDGRGGSSWLHRHAQVGRELTVSAPRNHFALHSDASPAILVAGGIGVTPILAMAHALKARGTAFSVHYFARNQSAVAFTAEWQEGPLAVHSHITLDDMANGSRSDFSARLSCEVTPDTHLYVCGPAGFMDAVVAELMTRGLSPQRVHRELFSGAQLPPDDAAAKAFEIELRSDGRIIHVASDRSVVQALAEAGIDVVVSCEQGLCGSCLTPVLAGLPDHRDQFMLPEEHERNDCFTPCCSRALTPRLVLDL